MTEVTAGFVKEIAPGVDMPVSGCVSSSLGFGLASILGANLILINYFLLNSSASQELKETL